MRWNKQVMICWCFFYSSHRTVAWKQYDKRGCAVVLNVSMIWCLWPVVRFLVPTTTSQKCWYLVHHSLSFDKEVRQLANWLGGVWGGVREAWRLVTGESVESLFRHQLSNVRAWCELSSPRSVWGGKPTVYVSGPNNRRTWTTFQCADPPFHISRLTQW